MFFLSNWHFPLPNFICLFRVPFLTNRQLPVASGRISRQKNSKRFYLLFLLSIIHKKWTHFILFDAVILFLRNNILLLIMQPRRCNQLWRHVKGRQGHLCSSSSPQTHVAHMLPIDGASCSLACQVIKGCLIYILPNCYPLFAVCF